MLIRFWGTRGSIASPGAGTLRYGGNTTCVELLTDGGAPLVFDAGTGARKLGARLCSDRSEEVHLLMSHFHWDHIQGLPFFEPLRSERCSVNIRVPSHLMSQADRILQSQLDPLFFPMARADLRARIAIESVLDEQEIADVKVRAATVDHPGGALAYRVDAAGDPARSVVFAPDSEITRKRKKGSPLEALCEGARVLIHDAMYTEEEYAQRHGWGHASHLAAVDLALRAHAQLLVLFHHHPDRTDDEVDVLVEECRALAGRKSKELLVVGAYEGLELQV